MRFTIAKKIVLATALMVALGAIIALYSVWGSWTGVILAEEMEQAYLPASTDARNVSVNVLLSRFGNSAFMISSKDEDEKTVYSYLDAVQSHMKILKDLASNPEYAESFKEVLPLFPEMEKEIARFVSSTKQSMTASKGSNAAGRRFELELNKIRQGVYNLSKTVLNALNTEVKGTDDAYKSDLLNMYALTSELASNMADISGIFALAVQMNSAAEFPAIRKLFTEMANNLKQLEAYSKTNKEMIRGQTKSFEGMVLIADETEKVFHNYANATLVMQDSVNALEKAIDKVSVMINDYLIENSKSSVASQMSALNVSIILLIVLIVVGIGTLFVLINSVTKQISKFVSLVGELTSGDGDLTMRIKATNNDELADLAANFNKFIGNVHEIIVEVKSSADEVASGNNQLAATMEELSQTFDSQTKQLSDMVSGMDNISHISRTAVDDLNGSLTILKKTTDLTRNGAVELGGIKDSIMNINSQTESLSVTISKLTESSAQIGDILGVINDIADQTNLLALNAAIEAARAGDAGRGFAVVADEVRKLAERTQKATSEIEVIISSLQRESETASREMKSASEIVLKGVQDIEKTSTGFNEVVTGVVGVNSDVQNVSHSVGEQYHSVQGVVDNTQVFASGLEESNAAVNEVSLTVSHLQEGAEKLKVLVGRFKS